VIVGRASAQEIYREGRHGYAKKAKALQRLMRLRVLCASSASSAVKRFLLSVFSSRCLAASL
jgi:hypothetical protein